jgi:hypothetical protein
MIIFGTVLAQIWVSLEQQKHWFCVVVLLKIIVSPIPGFYDFLGAFFAQFGNHI